MTAYLGEPLPASTLLYGGSHSLLRQSWAPRELLHGSVNADGWGVAWWRGERAVRLARAEPAWYDPDVRGVLEGARARCAVAALRNATPGLAVGPHAVAPLVRRDRAFVLNGFVPAFRERHMRALRERLPDDLYAELRGTSDTETLFLLVLAELEAGRSAGEALERVIGTVLEGVAGHGGGECQLTLCLAGADEVTIALASNVEPTNSLYTLEGGRLAPGGVLVASEALDDDAAWEAVPPHHLVEIRPEGTTTRPLARG